MHVVQMIMMVNVTALAEYQRHKAKRAPPRSPSPSPFSPSPFSSDFNDHYESLLRS